MSALAGKLVLVTGASAGIGRAAALAFTREGATVIATARSADKLDSLAKEAPGPGRIVPMKADVTDGPGMEAAAAAILKEHGLPDVVVANAGRGLDARFEATTDQALRELFETNVFGVWRTVRPFVQPMAARGSGRILLISSVVGKRGTPSYSAYSATKFALHGAADAMRAELWGTGVTVGIVCPSSTETEFDDRKLRAGVAQKKVRVQRHSAESVAEAIVKMARWKRREMVLSPEGKFMAIVNTISPKLFDWILWKALVKR